MKFFFSLHHRTPSDYHKMRFFYCFQFSMEHHFDPRWEIVSPFFKHEKNRISFIAPNAARSTGRPTNRARKTKKKVKSELKIVKICKSSFSFPFPFSQLCGWICIILCENTRTDRKMISQLEGHTLERSISIQQSLYIFIHTATANWKWRWEWFFFGKGNECWLNKKISTLVDLTKYSDISVQFMQKRAMLPIYSIHTSLHSFPISIVSHYLDCKILIRIMKCKQSNSGMRTKITKNSLHYRLDMNQHSRNRSRYTITKFYSSFLMITINFSFFIRYVRITRTLE